MKKLVHEILLLFLFMLIHITALCAHNKYALVIGNAAYEHTDRLNNPVNDAVDMKAALEEIGFNVDIVINGTLRQMNDSVTRFRTNLSKSKNTYGLFFYAGHGIQSHGENYLIPVDANMQDEADLPYAALVVQRVYDNIQQANNALNIIILDACRNNPFEWGKLRGDNARGLSMVSRQPVGSIIVYATSANKTADDGTGRNGLFTEQLLKNIKAPGSTINEVFDNTANAVIQVSNNKQIPAIYKQYFGTAYLNGEPPKQSSGQVSMTQNYTPAPKSDTKKSSINTDTNNFAYIEGGKFTMGSPTSEVDGKSDEVQRQVTVSSFYIAKYEITQAEYTSVMGTNPSNFIGADLPVENVSWYDAVEYCNKRSEREGLKPAYTINKFSSDKNNKNRDDTVRWSVTWNRTANGYRLPTEAEWEYACRALTRTAFNTGGNITTSQANYDGNYPYNNNTKGVYQKQTIRTGSFTPNAWGLHDMHGNVWEWCWNWYGNYSSGAQTDPMGSDSGSNRVLRGGSWMDSAKNLRSAYRNSSNPSARNNTFGFRVVHS